MNEKTKKAEKMRLQGAALIHRAFCAGVPCTGAADKPAFIWLGEERLRVGSCPTSEAATVVANMERLDAALPVLPALTPTPATVAEAWVATAVPEYFETVAHRFDHLTPPDKHKVWVKDLSALAWCLVHRTSPNGFSAWEDEHVEVLAELEATGFSLADLCEQHRSYFSYYTPLVDQQNYCTI